MSDDLFQYMVSEDNLVDDITSQFDTRGLWLISTIKQYSAKQKKILCGNIQSLSIEALTKTRGGAMTKSQLVRKSKFEARKRKRDIRDGILPPDTPPLVDVRIEHSKLPKKHPRVTFLMPDPEDIDQYWSESPARPDSYMEISASEEIKPWLTKACCDKISRLVRDVLYEMFPSFYDTTHITKSQNNQSPRKFAALIFVTEEKLKLIQTVLLHYYKNTNGLLDVLEDSDDGVLQADSSDIVEQDIHRQFQPSYSKYTELKGDLETKMIACKDVEHYVIEFVDFDTGLQEAYAASWYLRNIHLTLSKYLIKSEGTDHGSRS